MIIKANLFSKGHPLTGEVGLSQLLEGHRQRVLKSITTVAIDQMTDAYLAKTVKDSLVEPISIHFNKLTKKIRSDQIDGSHISGGSMAGRMQRHGISEADILGMMGGSTKQVARFTLPFAGDPKLLEFAPNPCGMTFPRGEVVGKTIQFDIVLFGSDDDSKRRFKSEFQENLRLLEQYATGINKQMKEFNESLPEQVKSTFVAKLDDLTKQHAIFDELGIPDDPEPSILTSEPESPAPSKKKKGRPAQIIQIIQCQYVQELKQINYNAGDVNNAIQSGE